MRTTLHAIRLVAVALLVLVGVSCKNDSSNPYGSPTSPPPANAPANTVLMSGMAFSPATITVSVGATVTWKNNDGYGHTATSDAGAWNAGNIGAGASASHTFTTAGTYPYHCTYHAAMGMKGTVIVK